MDGVGQVLDVPWVDDYGAIERLGSTGEFRENQNPLVVLLAGNVLVGNKFMPSLVELTRQTSEML